MILKAHHLSLWLIYTTLLLSGLAHSANDNLEIISLQHRQALDLVNTIKPFVDEGGVVRAQKNQLIIRSSEKNITDLKKIISKLDTPLRRLIIHVKQPRSGSRQDHSSDLGGQINLPQGTAKTILRRHRTADRDQASTDQQIQVLEGHTAMIKTGQLIPMAKQQSQNGKIISTIEHRDVSSGFQVTPHLYGDNVTLKIHPFSAIPSQQGAGIIEQQQAHTTLTGKLNEWIELGGANIQQANTNDVILYSTHSRNEQSRRILIKITEQP